MRAILLRYWIVTAAMAGIVGALVFALSAATGMEHRWPGVIVSACTMVLIRSAGAPR